MESPSVRWGRMSISRKHQPKRKGETLKELEENMRETYEMMIDVSNLVFAD